MLSKQHINYKGAWRMQILKQVALGSAKTWGSVSKKKGNCHRINKYEIAKTYQRVSSGLFYK